MHRPTQDSFVEFDLHPERVAEYLAHLGLGQVDPVREGIGCWTCLQAFVAGRLEIKPLSQPIRNTRLKTYGFERDHPVRMLLRHVLY